MIPRDKVKNITYGYANERAGLITHVQFVWIRSLIHINYAVACAVLTTAGGALVVVGQARGFAGDTLEQIVDKAVHDAHGLAGDTSIGVHLLHDFVHVDAVALSLLFLRLFLSPERGALDLETAFLAPLELTLGGMIQVYDARLNDTDNSGEIVFI